MEHKPQYHNEDGTYDESKCINEDGTLNWDAWGYGWELWQAEQRLKAAAATLSPQEAVLRYAEDVLERNAQNDKHFPIRESMTAMQLAGMMTTQDVAFLRSTLKGGDLTYARIRRQGKTITITETYRWQTHEIVDGKLIDIDHERATEVIRIDL